VNAQTITRRGFFIYFLPINDSNASPHLTVLGQINDVNNQGFKKLLETVNKADFANKPIHASLAETDYFGKNNEFEVVRLNSNKELQELHKSLLKITEDSGYEIMQPQYSGENYNPHISLSKNFTEAQLREAHEKDGIAIDSIVLKESLFNSAGEFISSELIGSLKL